MMTEEKRNYPISNQSTVIESRKQQINGASGVQVEWISKFLSECPEAATNVHKYLEKNYSNQQLSYSQQLNSTPNPKRGHPLDESGGSLKSGNGRHKHPRNDTQRNTQNDLHQQHDINAQTYQHWIAPSSERPQHGYDRDQNRNAPQHKRLPFDQLKHAVSSNLPCFHIQFTSETNRNKIPSALQASDIVFKELQSNGVRINRFTLVGWIGKKLKLGVNNKEDYAALVATDKWPSKINGMDIDVVKPKFVPDSFVLVVRYVPNELDDNFVESEIQHTIASADRIKRIHYAYQRKTNDYRFDVKDYEEYKSALQLGRIAIGHSWLSITQFFAGNRLTYCTRCWCIGHLRNKCNVPSRCRVCLESLPENASHVCTNATKCAQCDGDHHSLDNQCQIIQDYKRRLKEDVDDALNNGTLNRFAPKEQAPPFESQKQEFPIMKTSDNQGRMCWNNIQAPTTCQPNNSNESESRKSLEDINIKLSVLLDSNKRVENKIDQLNSELKIVTLDTQLHQAVLIDIITIVKDCIQQIIPPALTASKSGRMALIPDAQLLFNRCQSASIRLNDGFQSNRNICLTPSVTTSTANSASSMAESTNPKNNK